jgi:hypothetical protein
MAKLLPRAENHGFPTLDAGKGSFCGLSRFLVEKNRIKCGSNAIFPQAIGIRCKPSQQKSDLVSKEDSWLLA